MGQEKLMPNACGVICKVFTSHTRDPRFESVTNLIDRQTLNNIKLCCCCDIAKTFLVLSTVESLGPLALAAFDSEVDGCVLQRNSKQPISAMTQSSFRIYLGSLNEPLMLHRFRVNRRRRLCFVLFELFVATSFETIYQHSRSTNSSPTTNCQMKEGTLNWRKAMCSNDNWTLIRQVSPLCKISTLLVSSVTRSGDFLDFGKLFKAFGNK